MKRNVIFFILCLLNVSVKAGFQEDFSSDLSEWHGNDFIINDNQELQLQAEDAAESYIVRTSQVVVSAVWEFDVRLEFNPSAANAAKFYIISDSEELTDALNGYYVLLGGADDEISLYKQTNTTVRKIIAGEKKRLDNAINTFQVRITRSDAGEFVLYSKMATEEDFKEEGQIVDLTYLQSSFCGIYCKYTATRKDKFFFDNISVQGSIYQEPEPKSVYTPAFGDIVFSEIMAKPAPVVGLPDVEYIELYNRSDSIIELQYLVFRNGDKSYTLPDSLFYPHEYVVLCSSKAAVELAVYARCIEVKSFPALVNDGRLMSLVDEHEKAVAWVDYASSWYQDEFRENGGWSLECIDLNNLNGHIDNWGASLDKKGGTPGMVNSITGENRDRRTPVVENVSIQSPSEVTLSFNKPIQPESLSKKENYHIEKPLEIDSIAVHDPKGKEVTLYLSSPIEAGRYYELLISGLLDWDGNVCEASVNVALPEKTEPADIVINEILPYPVTGGSKFIELYNRSEKVLELSDVVLTTLSPTGALESSFFITTTSVLFPPHAYAVLSSDTEQLCTEYRCAESARFIQMKLPAMPAQEGTVVLATRDGTVIDYVPYHEKMHVSWLVTTQGVSLEKIHPGISGADESAWTSAAFDAGYATPGYRNSQYKAPNNQPATDAFYLESKSFTPNNDGTDDLLTIYYDLGTSGYMATITVYHSSGRKVRTLADNALLGTSGFFTWDGTYDDGRLGEVGIYAVYIEACNHTGKVIRKKLAAVLAL